LAETGAAAVGAGQPVVDVNPLRGDAERYFDRLAAQEAGVEPSPDASGSIPEVRTVGPPIGA